MTTVKSLLLWERWRPRTLDDIILLPRIRKSFENGVTQDYIFYGHFGTGKTSLSRILVGKYTKDKPYLELNSSLYTSIDVLRNEIDDFCKFSPIVETDSNIKYVYLDEFERTSAQFQDAFKAFVEKYDKNVRFIISTNHINKIDGGIKSRFKKLNFDYNGIEEEKYLKTEIYKKIKNVILPKENFDIPKEDLIKIINKKFPDFREILVDVQSYIETGNIEEASSNVSLRTKLDLYYMIYNASINFDEIYHYLMNSFGPDKIHIMIKLLGTDFINWSIENNKDADKLFEVAHLICEYTTALESETDPIIVGISLIGKLRKLLIK